MKAVYIGVFILASLYFAKAAALPLDCDDLATKFKIADFPGIGPKVASEEDVSDGDRLKVFFKKVGCQIQKGVVIAKDKAKELGSDLKEHAKKFGEKAKDWGSDMKTKFHEFKEKISHDSSSEEEKTSKKLFSNYESVEVFNPEVLMGEQKCGHGHILDAQGNCFKLRK